MYETIRIVNKLKPKYVIWENVKNLISKKHIHNFNAYIQALEDLGYKSYYKVLNAKDYGIPQNRERVFTISIRDDIDKEYIFPDKIESNIKLKDLLEKEVEEKYFLTETEKITYNRDFGSKGKEIDIDKPVPTLTASMGTGGGNIPILKIKNNTKKGYLEATSGDGVYTVTSTKRGTVSKESMHTITTRQDCGVVVESSPEYKEYTNFYITPRGSDGKLINGSYNRVWKDDKYSGTINLTKEIEIGRIEDNQLRIRKITSKEAWRLMGFDDTDYEKASKVCSNTQLYKQAGNSIVVNVLESILKNLI